MSDDLTPSNATEASSLSLKLGIGPDLDARTRAFIDSFYGSRLNILKRAADKLGQSVSDIRVRNFFSKRFWRMIINTLAVLYELMLGGFINSSSARRVIPLLPNEIRADAYRKFRHSHNKKHILESYTLIITMFSVTVVNVSKIAAGVAAFIFAPSLTALWFHATRPIWSFDSIYYCLTFVLAFLGIWGPTKLAIKTKTRDSDSMMSSIIWPVRGQIFVTWASSLTVLYLLIAYRIGIGLHHKFDIPAFIGSGLAGVAWWWIMVMLAAVTTNSIRNVMISEQTHRYNTYLDLHIPTRLAELLYTISSFPKKWGNLIFMREIMADLEQIALLFEIRLPGQLESGDAVTNDWMKQQSMQRAAYFRWLKTWILTPKIDTREQLIQQLRNDLISALTGNWDALEKREVTSSTIRQQWYSRIVHVGRQVMSGAIPIALVWIVQKPPISLKLPEYANLLALGFAGLTVMMTVDPSLSTKISTLKDIISMAAQKDKK